MLFHYSIKKGDGLVLRAWILLEEEKKGYDGRKSGAQNGEGLGDILLHGLDADAQSESYLLVGKVVAPAQQEDLSASWWKIVYSIVVYRLEFFIDGFIVGCVRQEALCVEQVCWNIVYMTFKERVIRTSLADTVEAAVTHGREQKPLRILDFTSFVMLPKWNEAVVYHVDTVPYGG